MTTHINLPCPFCMQQHDADMHEHKFFDFTCEEYGAIYISDRAITELERHPEKLKDAKSNALECKDSGGKLKITYHATDRGLQKVCVYS